MDQQEPQIRGDLDDEDKAKIALIEQMFSNFGALTIDVAHRTGVNPGIVSEGMVHGLLRVLVVIHKNLNLTEEEERNVVSKLAERLPDAYGQHRQQINKDEDVLMRTMGLKAPEGARTQ